MRAYRFEVVSRCPPIVHIVESDPDGERVAQVVAGDEAQEWLDMEEEEEKRAAEDHATEEA